MYRRGFLQLEKGYSRDMSRTLQKKSLLILVGGRFSGIAYQMNRLLEASSIFRPVITYTDAMEFQPDEEEWYEHVQDRREFIQMCYGAYLAYYYDGSYLYVVKKRDVVKAVNEHHIALVGMPSHGYQSYIAFEANQKRFQRFEAARSSRWECSRDCPERCTNFCYEQFHHSAIALTPENGNVFRDTLIHEFGFYPEAANECLKKAIADSTLPPSSSETSDFVFPVSVRGPRDVAFVQSVMDFLPS